MTVCILQMLYFDRSDVPEGTAVDKKSALKVHFTLVFFKLWFTASMKYLQ